MDHRTFMDEMLKPSFVWTMAHGRHRSDQKHHGAQSDTGASTRMRDAEEKIDRLVLLRAEAIKHEHDKDKTYFEDVT